MKLEIRTIGDDELEEFTEVEAAGFGSHPDEHSLEEKRWINEPGRAFAAFADGRMVGTTNSYSFGLTLPGGTDGTGVASAGVSDVTVSATHRRRGILRAMMAEQLDDVAARDEPLALLNASEAAIYGRFGYGLAQSYQSWEIDTHRTAFREPVGDGVELRRIDRHEAASVLPDLYDTWRRQQPGAMTHSTDWWRCLLDTHLTWKGGGEIFVVVAEPTADHRGGYAIYLIDDRPPSGEWVLDARNVVAVDDVVEARLWRYLFEVDLVGPVQAEAVALDHPLRWWLTDARQVRTTQIRDYLFVRILDIPRVLTARTYHHDGVVVLDVHDRFRPQTAGRYRLEQRDGAVTCELTAGPADLELEVTELGSLLLGGVSARELARAGLVSPVTADAVARTDELFGWPMAPFCITRF